MSSIGNLIQELFIPRLRHIEEKAKNDQDRSKSVLDYLISTLVKPGSIDPSDIEWQVTDQPSDGGLDAYVADPGRRTLMLFQCKWFSKLQKISEKDSSDLYDFYTNKMLRDDRTNLSDRSRFVIARYQQLWKNFRCELVYVTNGELDPAAIARYKELSESGVIFRLINESEMGKAWYDSLASEKPIRNEMVVAVKPEHSFSTECIYPSVGEQPEKKIRVLQCMLSAQDLVRAYDIYRRDLLIRNLRFGLGGKINEDMQETANRSERTAFYVFHNGISIVTRKFEVLDLSKGKLPSQEDIKKGYPELSEAQAQYVTDSMGGWGHTHFVRMIDLQIVNGGQSTVTLAGVPKEKLKDIFVPCKISETDDRRIAEEIAMYNNTQNRITPADLVANNDEQSFLQNFAAVEIDPPIFYQRKEKEQWTDIFRARGPAPTKERWVEYVQTYQAFLSWMGKPGPAYVRTASLVAGYNAPYYHPISDFPKKDIVLTAGLIAKYEKIAHKADTKKTPDFVEYWTQWVIATVGHIWQYVLDSKQQESLKTALLSAKGFEVWKKLRVSLMNLFGEIFEELPKKAFKDPQALFKNNEEVFDLSQITFVKPNDIARYLPPRARGPTLLAMKDLARHEPPSLSYYDPYFAVFAGVIDKLLSSDKKVLELTAAARV